MSDDDATNQRERVRDDSKDIFWMSESYLAMADLHYRSHFKTNRVVLMDMAALFASYAFGFELIMKCWSLVEGRRSSRIHRLNRLFAYLSKTTQREINLRYQETVKHFVENHPIGSSQTLSEKCRQSLTEVLDDAADAFVRYRYWHESVTDTPAQPMPTVLLRIAHLAARSVLLQRCAQFRVERKCSSNGTMTARERLEILLVPSFFEHNGGLLLVNGYDPITEQMVRQQANQWKPGKSSYAFISAEKLPPAIIEPVGKTG